MPDHPHIVTPPAPERAPMTVLVAGATGRFGGIVELLLGRGHRVRAATRAPHSPVAARLAERGAEAVRADFDDMDSLHAAARGVDAVFASGTAHRTGPDGETRHGRNLTGALAAAKVPHLIFVSGAGADRRTGVPVLEAKAAVEQQLRDLSVPTTLIAPTYLMENLFNPWNLPALRAGQLPTPVPPWQRLQQVATRDVVALAALAIERPDEFVGERIEVASDEPTGEEAASALSGILGFPFVASELPRTGLPPGLVALFEWLERDPFTVNIGALRQRFTEVSWHRFAAWADEHKRQLPPLDHPSRVP